MEQALCCPECGAPWSGGRTCRDYFDEMLAREFADPAGAGSVHHLTVLCYGIQHPSMYSDEGWDEAIALLSEFVERGTPPDEVRRRNQARLDSGHRAWKISGTPTLRQHPLRWPMTVADAAAAGCAGHCECVRAWARSVHAALREG